MAKKNILFVNQSQFGYHIDYIQYCKYLKEEFEITYICWDYNRKKIEESGIKVHYVLRNGNIINRNTRFIKSVLSLLNQQKFSLVFIHFFRGASILPFLNLQRQNMHLDIRTGCVSPNAIQRLIYNSIIRFESMFFRSHSIISIGLRNKLGINKNAYILPLGANPTYVNRQIKYKLHLLYIGTLSSRRIEDTIEGMRLFLNKQPKADIFYTIVGDGWQNEKQKLQNRTNKLGLNKHIQLTGYIPHNELMRYYRRTNVGISYIPITPYYEFQPVTKTFEYLMSGMPVIATNTYENNLVLNQNNGILIKDTPESFACGIEEIYQNIGSFNEDIIRKSVETYSWSRIIQNMKETILM